MRRSFLFLYLLTSVACGRDPARTGQGQVGHASDSVLAGGADTVQSAGAGIELETPRLLPGLRAQLAALSDTGGGASEGNLTAYRTLAADVVKAMETDLNRVGSPEVKAISEKGDSVLGLLGGGAGSAVDAGPEQARQSIRLMEDLIQRYEQAMSAVRQ